jgi:hypothetical protein
MGLNIGFLPKHMIIDELREGSLVIKEIEVPRQPESIYMAWHKGMLGQVVNWSGVLATKIHTNRSAINLILHVLILYLLTTMLDTYRKYYIEDAV